jgi:hypothetical protein
MYLHLKSTQLRLRPARANEQAVIAKASAGIQNVPAKIYSQSRESVPRLPGNAAPHNQRAIFTNRTVGCDEKKACRGKSGPHITALKMGHGKTSCWGWTSPHRRGYAPNGRFEALFRRLRAVLRNFRIFSPGILADFWVLFWPFSHTSASSILLNRAAQAIAIGSSGPAQSG